jgi:transcriptional regulator with XRE-family HTH domain
MAIAREELYEKGRAFFKQRFNGGGAAALRSTPVVIVEIMRGACRVKDEKNGREYVCKFSELEPDHEWLDERDRLEEEKKERIRKEALAPFEIVQPKQPVVRLVEESKPLTASFAELLKHKEPVAPAPVVGNSPDKWLQNGLDSEWRELESKEAPAPAALDEKWDVFGPMGPPKTPTPPEEDEDEDEAQELEFKSGMSTTAQRVADLRKAKAWSVNELARKCGCTWTAVDNWERGRAKPQGKSVARLAKAFGVPTTVITCLAPIPDNFGKSQLSMHSGVYAKIDVNRPKGEEPKMLHIPQHTITAATPRPEPDMVHIPGKREEPLELVSHKGEICEPPPLEETSIMPVPKAGFDMWLEMGRRMREPLQSELAQLDATIAPLEQRLLDMMERKSEVADQLAALDAMLSKRGTK